MSDKTKHVTLDLSEYEALVLFEFLSRFSNDKDLRIDDQAEARVLWDLCCVLETQLVEPLREDYSELLRKARNAVRDPRD